MKKSATYLFFLIISLVITLTCFAAAKKAPYSAIVPIADYSDGERNKAFVSAYKQIIASLSGDAKDFSSEEVKEKLRDITVWVKSYSYTKQLPPEISAALPADNKGGLFLQVVFDPVSIPEKLKPDSSGAPVDRSKSGFPLLVTVSATKSSAAPLPKEGEASSKEAGRERAVVPSVVSRERPTILVWLVVLAKDPRQNLLLDDSNNSKLAQELKAVAHRGSFSVTLPAMDLEEITTITADDICNFDAKVIKNAAKRYGVKNIVTGCVAAPEVHSASSVFGRIGMGESAAKITRHSEWLLLAGDDKKASWKETSVDDVTAFEQALKKAGELLNVAKPASKVTELTPNIPARVSSLPPPSAKLSPDSSGTTATTAAVTQLESPSLPPIASPAAVVSSQANGAAAVVAAEEKADSAVLKVNNVDNLDQYAAVVKYLRTLPQITKVDLLHISATTVELKVAIVGGKNSLVKSLKNQQQLQPVKHTDDIDSDLNYVWVPKVS